LDGVETTTETVGASFVRTGCMSAFDSFEHFEQYSDEILDLLEDFASPAFVNAKVLEAVEAVDSMTDGRLSTSINVSLSDPITRANAAEEAKSTEPIHIISVAIRDTGVMDDVQMAHVFGTYCKIHREELFQKRIRRITFAALKRYVRLATKNAIVDKIFEINRNGRSLLKRIGNFLFRFFPFQVKS